ncbi:MAG: type II toxin-antitoxin system YafQ family toxin [Polaromonas sp.]|uniref:type II toxin-antitoxin system YafQ family toxin n=1 Tax=Polaromonas sp. TaxID=1869339 RepID=UPI002733AA93|nr:type II toxin-antitoxin system YafQ family toxin [Polaromonas sp.]MDP2819808.1 type II toxin-antitoxin system YafQ family toxin [Polaromonas sp.]
MLSIKKPAKAKRAPLPRKSDYTKQFDKDWEKLSHSGKQDMQRLKEAMMLVIANEGPLPAEWLDHELEGEWADHRECHAKGDLLLIYRLAVDSVIFVRAGTHSELFGR